MYNERGSSDNPIFIANFKASTLVQTQLFQGSLSLSEISSLQLIYRGLENMVFCMMQQPQQQTFILIAFLIDPYGQFYFNWEKRLENFPNGFAFEGDMFIKQYGQLILMFGVDPSTNKFLMLWADKRNQTESGSATFLNFKLFTYSVDLGLNTPDYQIHPMIQSIYSTFSQIHYYCFYEYNAYQTAFLGMMGDIHQEKTITYRLTTGLSSTVGKCSDLRFMNQYQDPNTLSFLNETLLMLFPLVDKIVIFQLKILNGFDFLNYQNYLDGAGNFVPFTIFGSQNMLRNLYSGSYYPFSQINGRQNPFEKWAVYLYGSLSQGINCFYDNNKNNQISFLMHNYLQEKCPAFNNQYTNSTQFISNHFITGTYDFFQASYSESYFSLDFTSFPPQPDGPKFSEPEVDLLSLKTKCHKLPGFELPAIYFDQNQIQETEVFYLQKLDTSKISGNTCTFKPQYNFTLANFTHTAVYDYNSTHISLTVGKDPSGQQMNASIPIQLKVYEHNTNVAGTVYFTLYTTCNITSVPVLKKSLSIKYTVGSQAIDTSLLQLFDLTTLTPICKTLTFSLNSTTTEPVDLEVFVIMINVLRVYTPEESKVGNYKFKLQLAVNGVTSAQIDVSIQILQKPQENTNSGNLPFGASFGNCQMKDIRLFTMQADQYELPSCFQTLQAQQYIVDINLKPIKQFTHYAYNSLYFSPREQHTGIYQIKVTLRDSQYNDLGKYIDFKVFVFSSSSTVKCPSTNTNECIPRITLITSTGQVKIQFPYKIIPAEPKNYTNVTQALKFVLNRINIFHLG